MNKTSENTNTAKALEIIAMNTMCTREAISVAAKSIMAWIISSVAIAIAIIVLGNNPIANARDVTGVHWVCLATIIIFGLFAVIYPLVLISGLNRTISRVRESEEQSLGDKSEE